MIPHRNVIKDIGRILFWYPVRWCVLLIPMPLIHRLGKQLGNLDYFLSGSKRIEKMTRNISKVFKAEEKELREIIRKNLQNHIQNVLELMKYPRLNKKNMTKLLSFEGLEILDEELSKRRGVILATAHFGAKQLLQVGLGLHGYKLNQIHYHMSEDELSLIQKKVSQKQRMRIEKQIPITFIASDSFMRSVLNCLKNNEVVILAADGIGIPKHMKKGYEPFSFFNEKMFFPTNFANLSIRTGASVLPVFVVREVDMRHKIIIEPPINNHGSGRNTFVNILTCGNFGRNLTEKPYCRLRKREIGLKGTWIHDSS
jgi:KDO2-lipid IV(A) lauroyltransferase